MFVTPSLENRPAFLTACRVLRTYHNGTHLPVRSKMQYIKILYNCKIQYDLVSGQGYISMHNTCKPSNCSVTYYQNMAS